MFTTHVCKHFWEEVVFAASYLVNRLLSRILQFQILLDNSFSVLFPYLVIHLYTYKNLACTTFIHNTSSSHGKLDNKAMKCIFWDYSLNWKEYKCYCPTKKIVSPLMLHYLRPILLSEISLDLAPFPKTFLPETSLSKASFEILVFVPSNSYSYFMPSTKDNMKTGGD